MPETYSKPTTLLLEHLDEFTELELHSSIRRDRFDPNAATISNPSKPISHVRGSGTATGTDLADSCNCT